MIEFILTALVASVTGAVYMFNILRKESNKKILERKKYFKYSHNNFWAKIMSDGSVEFWAYSCQTEESWFLGKYENNTIIECDGFFAHALPWSVQKGAERIFKQFQNL